MFYSSSEEQNFIHKQLIIALLKLMNSSEVPLLGT